MLIFENKLFKSNENNKISTENIQQNYEYYASIGWFGDVQLLFYAVTKRTTKRGNKQKFNKKLQESDVHAVTTYFSLKTYLKKYCLYDDSEMWHASSH